MYNTPYLLTSGDRPGDLNRAKELGVFRYFLKPVNPSQLLDAVIQILDTSDSIETEKPRTSTPQVLTKPIRVLLAEDNRVNQVLAIKLLQRMGATVVAVENGEEVIQALNNDGPFDIVLMDVQMPVMGGFETTQAIRQSEKETSEHIPIIALTAHALKGDREKCLEAGMDDYVAKPIRESDLSETLVRYIPSTRS